ncbi:MAG: MFS transporter [Eubacteriaceae bacterium]|nr:MFS transporter [Eubacteriaceae bacterium]
MAGLGSGTIVACSSRVIASQFEPQRRGTAMGIFFSATMAGLLLSNKLAPIALEIGSWRKGFVWLGMGLMFLSVLLFLFIQKEPRKETNETIFGGVTTVFKVKNVVIMAFVGFTYIWLVLAFATWANRYMGSIGIEVADASSVMSWYSISALVGTFLGGWAVDAFKLNRRYFVVVMFILMVVTTFVFAKQTTVMGLSLVAALYGFVSYLPNSNLTTLVVYYAGDQYAGTAVGGINFIWQFGAVLSPTIAGAVFEFTGSFNSVWIMLVALPLLGIVSLFSLRSQEQATI